jgi:hypothetical protein
LQELFAAVVGVLAVAFGVFRIVVKWCLANGLAVIIAGGVPQSVPHVCATSFSERARLAKAVFCIPHMLPSRPSKACSMFRAVVSARISAEISAAEMLRGGGRETAGTEGHCKRDCYQNPRHTWSPSLTELPLRPVPYRAVRY